MTKSFGDFKKETKSDGQLNFNVVMDDADVDADADADADTNTDTNTDTDTDVDAAAPSTLLLITDSNSSPRLEKISCGG